MIHSRFLLGSLLAIVVSAAAAQDAKKSRVTVIGASVSGGFVDPRPGPEGRRNSTVDLGRMFKAALPREHFQVRQRANIAMFMNPRTLGQRMVDRLGRDNPDLVLAVDFMVWFGYGPSARNEKAALKLQAEGLALLDRIKAPIVIGTYPNMAGADPGMLPAHYVPRPAVLKVLNERLQAWAKARPRVVVFPLAEWVAKVKQKGEVLEFGGDVGKRRARAAHLLQSDRLHASRLGMALLSDLLLEAAQGALPEKHPMRAVDVPLTRWVEIARAGPEVEDLEALEDK